MVGSSIVDHNRNSYGARNGTPTLRRLIDQATPRRWPGTGAYSCAVPLRTPAASAPVDTYRSGTMPRHRHNDRLLTLVSRVAAGDRAAFRTLYAFLSTQVWHDAVQALPPVDAKAVMRSTFVEVWHLAGHHADPGGPRETRDWVRSITARHIADRIRLTAGRPCHDDSYDRHTQRELAAMLGEGRATIRTAPAIFTRVGDIAS